MLFTTTHVPLNANELCSPYPSLPWGDEQFSRLLTLATVVAELANKHIIRKGDLQRCIIYIYIYIYTYCIYSLLLSIGEAELRMICVTIDTFR